MEVHSLAVPEHPFGLMAKVYREVFPLVHQELDKWKRKAETIQNPELKTQEEGLEYIRQQYQAHGELGKAVLGMHFNQSLSGDYVRGHVGT